jgi:hypothetical protein
VLYYQWDHHETLMVGLEVQQRLVERFQTPYCISNYTVSFF